MRTRTGRRNDQGRPNHRLRPGVNRLDARLVLSGSALGSAAVAVSPYQPIIATPPSPTLSVVSTTPANSSVLATSPSTLVVTFDRPVDDFSVGNDDFELVHVASDGSTSPVLPGESVLTESLDPDGFEVDISLSKPLALGNYELILSPDNTLAGLDGTPVVTPASGLVLADFQVSPPRESIDSAIDLDAIGPEPTAVSGQLDLAADPGAVQYYKFELGPGHHWLVGLGTAPLGVGGTIDPEISLFDSQGHLISTQDQSLVDDPNASYLSEGLDPGIYYVGISSQKNIPDASGTYHLNVLGASPADPDGSFQLEIQANQADQATHLLGLQLDHADPLSTAPTGLTLQFSGGLDATDVADSSDPALTLVDQAGKAWAVTPISYDSSKDVLSVAFDQPLAPGSYTVELSGPQSLLDLAGRVPIAAGFPAGTLGTFDLAPSTSVAGDLGVILPGNGSPTAEATVDLGAGRSSTEHFVALQSGLFRIEGTSSAGDESFSVEDQAGEILAQGQVGPGTSSTFVALNPGDYQVLLSGGPRASQVTLSIQQERSAADSIIESGVSQGPAIALRLATPQADQGPASNSSTAVSNASGSLVGVPTAALNGSSTAIVNVPGVGLVSPVGSSVAGGTYSPDPVGRPSGKSNSISVVGLSGSSGLASIASNSPDLPAGLLAIQDPVEANPPGGSEATPADPATEAQGLAATPTGITLESGLLARPPGSRKADDRSLADADWIGRIVARAVDWLESTPAEAIARESLAAPTTPTPSAATGPVSEEGIRVENASMASPIGLSLATGIAAYGYARRVLSRKTTPVPGAKKTPILAGPHRRPKALVR